MLGHGLGSLWCNKNKNMKMTKKKNSFTKSLWSLRIAPSLNVLKTTNLPCDRDAWTCKSSYDVSKKILHFCTNVVFLDVPFCIAMCRPTVVAFFIKNQYS